MKLVPDNDPGFLKIKDGVEKQGILIAYINKYSFAKEKPYEDVLQKWQKNLAQPRLGARFKQFFDSTTEQKLDKAFSALKKGLKPLIDKSLAASEKFERLCTAHQGQ